MKRSLLLVFACLVTLVAAQTKNSNGNPTGEIGSIAFDEIVVHSNLQVRGKSANRAAKALVSKPTTSSEGPMTIALLSSDSGAADGSAETVLSLKRTKRVPRRNHGYNNGGFGGFPSSSSSAASASSNAFNQNTPFGNFGGSASQSATQSQSFGPHGPQASAGQSASQTYNLPNGNTIDVSFSSAYNFGGRGGPNYSNSNAITVTRPNGQKYQLGRRK